MIRLDLQLFGGRGGTSTSARWMDGFFKSARRNAPSDSKDAYDIDTAKSIYRRLVKAKSESGVTPRGGYEPIIEGRILKDWARQSKVAKYNDDTGTLTIAPGKLAEARREFERYVKGKYKSKYYKRGTAIKKK